MRKSCSVWISYHNSVDYVVVVVLQGPYSLRSWHVGLRHDEFDVLDLHASLVNLNKMDSVNIQVNTQQSCQFCRCHSSATSSSSLSSCTVGVCVFSWMLETASPCTLNFSAAASWACWERSSIYCRRKQRIQNGLLRQSEKYQGSPVHTPKAHYIVSNKGTAIEEQRRPAAYLGFTEDNVGIWCGTLVDVWFGDDE